MASEGMSGHLPDFQIMFVFNIWMFHSISQLVAQSVSRIIYFFFVIIFIVLISRLVFLIFFPRSSISVEIEKLISAIRIQGLCPYSWRWSVVWASCC